MASTNGRSTRDLIAEITEDASRFRFFQAIRLLALSSEKNNGESIPDALRFATPVSLAFPASEIVHVKERRDVANKLPVELEHGDDACATSATIDENDPLALMLTVGFMGLTGPSGVLPQVYTELLIERRNVHRDSSAHSFFDLFSHRLVSLFYAAWRKHRFYLAYEAGERDRFSRNILDLVGVGLKSLQSRLHHTNNGVPDVLLTHYAGLLAQKPMSAVSLAAVLRGYFKVDVEVEQFIGQWIAVPENEQSRLGKQSCILGEDAFAGERLWDRQTKIQIKLGPLTDSQFFDFFPHHPGHIALTELVRFCVGHSLACDVSLTLERQAVPLPLLSSSNESQLRLGYNTWMCSAPPPQNLSDTHYHLLT